jgi:hypothetical protein
VKRKSRNPWDKTHPDRFLWNNGGWYWMRYTPYDAVYTQKRQDVNLKTKDLNEARTLRDSIAGGWDWNRATT